MVARDSTRIRLHMPLERFSLLEGVFHGVVEHFVSATEAPSHFCSKRRLAAACSFRRRPGDDDETPSEKVSANSQVVAAILRCVQALRAVENAGPAFGPLGPLALLRMFHRVGRFIRNFWILDSSTTFAVTVGSSRMHDLREL